MSKTTDTKTSDFADNAINFRFAVNSAPSRAVGDEDENELEALRADTATLHAERIALIRSRNAGSAIGHISRAADKLIEARSRRLSDDEYKETQGRINHAVRLLTADRELRKLEKDCRGQVISTKEVDPYAKGSPHSWIVDRLTVSGDQAFAGRSYPGAEERLQRHGRIVARAVDKGTRYGRMVESMYAQDFRQQDLRRDGVEKALAAFRRDMRTGHLTEARGLTTGGGATASASGGSAAAFVPPSFLLNQFMVYRSPRRVVADQLNKSVGLPDYGLNVYVPQLTSNVSVGTTVEGGATAEADPSIGFLGAAVVDKSGQLTLSQAAIDRTGPGISFDVWVMAQLKDALGAQIDLVAINALLAGANTVTDSSAFALVTASGVGGAFKDIREAKKATIDTAGVRVRSTHLFVPSDFADWIEAYADAEGRPVFSPCLTDTPPPLKVAGDPNGEGFTGYVVQSLALFADENIPESGSDFQLIVTRPDFTLLLEGPPRFAFYPQYQAQNLDPVINVRAYVASVPRQPAAVSVISGAAYAASSFV